MASDYAVHYLTQPTGIAFLLALVLFPAWVLSAVAGVPFRKIGWKRVLMGHASVAVALLLLGLAEAHSVLQEKIAAGHVSSELFGSWLVNGTLYMAVVFYPVALFYLALLVLPFTLWRVHRGGVTLGALAVLGIISAFVIAALSAAFPSNLWASENPAKEFAAILSSIGLAAFFICVAFGIGLRAPLRPKKA